MLKSKANLTPVHKSKSKEKSSQQTHGFLKTKEQPYMSTKGKKEILPVSSYKIKLMWLPFYFVTVLLKVLLR